MKLIAYDLGTGGVKASLYDSDMNTLAKSFIEYGTSYPKSYMHEQKPEDWWSGVVSSTQSLLKKSSTDAEEIGCLALSGHSLVCVPIDRSGRELLRGVPIWSDTRASAEAEEFFRRIDRDLWYMWLTDCGLVHKVSRVNAAGIPLKAYEDLRAFKLFVVDVGLLGCMTGLRQQTLLDGNDLFVEFKGALTEQYVCQQLKTIEDLSVYYYTNDRSACEVDFIIDTGEHIIPVEVKAEVNLRAKSLRTYREKFEPEISVRTSMADYKKEDWLVNLPLYAIEEIADNYNVITEKSWKMKEPEYGKEE